MNPKRWFTHYDEGRTGDSHVHGDVPGHALLHALSPRLLHWTGELLCGCC
jgi:hypothetical protein